MGKITDALKKAAQERLSHIEKLDGQNQVKYQFIAKKTVDSKIDPRIVTFYDSHSPVTEQYRTLRTHIQSLNPQKPVRAFAITSAIHGEGKTVTSVNLAITMAKDLNKKSILLVDADLRRPRISKYLGVTAETGLAEVIGDNAAVDDALLNIGIENLTVLPAGKSVHNAAELFSSAKVSGLLTNLKSRYDYIVVDVPPIIAVTDPSLLGTHLDGVMMVVQAGRTQKGIVKHAQSLLKQSQVKLLGCVLTSIQYHIPAYIYRYL